MVASYMSTRRVSRDFSEVWISSYISSVVSIFSHSDAFVQAMTNVGPPEDLGVLSSDEDQRVCGQYGRCIIPFHECLFPSLVIVSPLMNLKNSVINHVLISLL